METEPTKETLLAFVDEIGDRGHSKKSSEYFAMSAVIFPSSSQQKVKDCIARIKTKLGIPLQIPLHWRKHCRMHDVRKFIAGEIAEIKNLSVIYVVSDKKTVPEDHAKFYNIVAALTLERILNHSNGGLKGGHKKKPRSCVIQPDIVRLLHRSKRSLRGLYTYTIYQKHRFVKQNVSFAIEVSLPKAPIHRLHSRLILILRERLPVQARLFLLLFFLLF